jgi:predicted Ser/Thr protein kinase
MTRKGFKAVVVRQEAYDMAFNQAEIEDTSIADIVTKAIQWYLNRRLEMEETIRTIYRVYEESQRKFGVSSPSSPRTP